MKKIYVVLFILCCGKLVAQPSCNWAYIPDSTNAYHTIYNVTTDLNGNIIQTGKILGVADMDPGAGPADTSFSGSGEHYYVSKTSLSGQLIWIKYFQLEPNFTLFGFDGVQVNSQNNIVIAGNFFGRVDFDLSLSGVDTLRSHFPTYPDYFVATYDSSGNLLWVFSIGDTALSTIQIQSFSLLPNDNILVGVNPNGFIDVDPGPAIHNTIGANANLICYDPNGNYLWNTNIDSNYSNAINNKSMDCDAAGNIYFLTVGYYELTVNKFDNNGTRLWNFTIGDFTSLSRVNPQSVLVDKSNGDFYVAGTFGDTVDFDPGPATVNEISSSFNYQDGFIAKYDSSMNLLWVDVYHGNISFGNYSLDFSGNDIVAVGNLTGTIDFGNGISLSAPTLHSPFFIQVNNSGNTMNGYILHGGGGYNTINTTINNAFVTSGDIYNNTDMDPTTATLTLNATTDNFFDAVYTTLATGISKPVKNNSLMVFPNPANDFLFVISRANALAHLYDMNGREVLSQNILSEKKTIVNVSSLAEGTYLLKAGTGFQKIRIVR